MWLCHENIALIPYNDEHWFDNNTKMFGFFFILCGIFKLNVLFDLYCAGIMD